MVDVKKELILALKEAGLPVFYELFVNPQTPTPCITYIETTNNDEQVGDTLQYSRVGFTIKVWAKRVEDLTINAQAIDRQLKLLGYRRISSNELFHGDMGQKIMRYEAIAYEVN